MHTRTLAALAVVISTAACGSAAQLRPAPNAALAPSGPGDGTLVQELGVELEVRSNAWSGDPVALDREITPLFVRITNNSEHDLLVHSPAFALLQGGSAYIAIPPKDVDDTVRENYYYPGYGYYWGDWSSYRKIELPTQDMIRLALPEGVLARGQTIEGFLFFEDLDDDIADVTFALRLIAAPGQRAFGHIEIPFVAY